MRSYLNERHQLKAAMKNTGDIWTFRGDSSKSLGHTIRREATPYQAVPESVRAVAYTGRTARPATSMKRVRINAPQWAINEILETQPQSSFRSVCLNALVKTGCDILSSERSRGNILSCHYEQESGGRISITSMEANEDNKTLPSLLIDRAGLKNIKEAKEANSDATATLAINIETSITRYIERNVSAQSFSDAYVCLMLLAKQKLEFLGEIIVIDSDRAIKGIS